jgi:hypothetical protein
MNKISTRDLHTEFRFERNSNRFIPPFKISRWKTRSAKSMPPSSAEGIRNGHPSLVETHRRETP